MKENYNKTDGYRESIQIGLKGLKTVGKNISSESELNREKIEFLKNEIENALAFHLIQKVLIFQKNLE